MRRLLLLLCLPLTWAADPAVVSLSLNDQSIPAVNVADGASVNPRIAVRFSGPVDTDTLRSTIFITPADTPFDIIRINQVIYDPQTFTVYAKPDRVLDQRRQYRLLVAGPNGVIASSTFTTMSVSTWLERVRGNLAYTPPSFTVGPLYKFSDLSTFTLHQQIHTNPSRFQDTALPVSLIGLIGGIGSVAFASYRSPTYLNANQTIERIPTADDPGRGLGTNQLYFHAVLPATAKPAAGYPVIIYGHGLGDSQWGGSSAVAPTMVPAGFAIIAINAVGHGYGPDSTVIVGLKNGQQVQLPAGGRSIPDFTGTIQPSSGCVLASTGFGIRDCLRQTAIDLMQLVRTIKSGVDLDSDGTVDLDPGRIYYIGQSLGSLYGTLFAALETDLSAVTLNAGGGSVIDIARWSPAFQPLLQQTFGLSSSFNENYVLPDQPVKINDVPGAIAIQNTLELVDWANQIGDPLAYAPLLRPSLLPGQPRKRILFQYATGDQTVPNTTEAALVKAAGMRESTWVFRNDLARTAFPGLPQNPHAYLTNILSGGPALSVALAVQNQIAGFFTSNGTKIPDPNTPTLNYFEVPP